MNVPKIEVRNLHLEQAGQVILENVNFSILPGEIVMIIGPSGSGKSTLLRSINRLLEPQPGSIFLDGHDITTLPVTELRCKAGMVFQHPSMFDGTVAENIAFCHANQGLDLSKNEIAGFLDSVSLSKAFIEKNANHLSGGEAQRVALARTLATHPEVILLDEPTSSLDPHATRQVEETLIELNQKQGITLLWVSHTIEQTRRVGKKVLLLSQGTVLAFGPVKEILDPVGPYQEALAFAAGEDITREK